MYNKDKFKERMIEVMKEKNSHLYDDEDGRIKEYVERLSYKYREKLELDTGMSREAIENSVKEWIDSVYDGAMNARREAIDKEITEYVDSLAELSIEEVLESGMLEDSED